MADYGNPNDTEPKTETEFVGAWVEAIESARRDERSWIESAEAAVAAFRGAQEGASGKVSKRHFNIFHANVETLVPAVFNSVPVPDVRRRFGDDDPNAKTVSELLERSLSFVTDDGHYENVVTCAVYDMVIAGRGLIRNKYVPTIEGENDAERITDERIETEYVPYQRFIRGPGMTWDDVPWCAFEHYLPKEEMERLAPDMLSKVPFTYSAIGKADTVAKADDNTPERFRRARVFEIWDKRTREVIFVSPDCMDYALRKEADPLQLKDFWPFPRPAHFTVPVDGLVPICPYAIYRDLIEELNEVTRRIQRLVKQLRPRALYMGNNDDVARWANADDGELVAIQNTEGMYATGGGGAERLLSWFPLETTAAALQQLYQQREAIKQTIYEVAGIPDIVRGATDPRETFGAQQIKAQSAGARFRSIQAEVARFVRDDYRIKAELIAKRFQPQTVMAMTSIRLLPEQVKASLMQMAQANPEQAQQVAAQEPELKEAMERPSADEVFQLLRSDQMRGYRVDIETDSTILADQQKWQQEMSTFLQGTGQFLSAIGPMVQQGAIPAEAAIEIYAGFARNFRLGKAAEDALDRLAENARNAPPQDPNAAQNAVEQGKLQIEQQKAQSQIQLEAGKAQAAQAMQQQKMSSDAEAKAMELQFKAQMAEREQQHAERLAEMKMQIEAYKAEMDIARKAEADRMNAAVAARNGAMKAAVDARKNANRPTK
jgi:putative intracellular protease/amidase